jgi:hypothetical protein
MGEELMVYLQTLSRRQIRIEMSLECTCLPYRAMRARHPAVPLRGRQGCVPSMIDSLKVKVLVTT